MLEELVLVHLSSRIRLWAVNIRTTLQGHSKVVILANPVPQGVNNKVAMPKQHCGTTEPRFLLPHRFVVQRRDLCAGAHLSSHPTTEKGLKQQPTSGAVAAWELQALGILRLTIVIGWENSNHGLMKTSFEACGITWVSRSMSR